jgi:hypothetical protein
MSTPRKEGLEAVDGLAESGQRLYDERLCALLEPEHEGEFVAIEPETERYFLGSTGLAAFRAGRNELPDKLFYLLRVGHDAAYRVGVMAREEGSVNARREPWLRVQTAAGKTLDCLIDTGFDEALVLPRSEASSLNLIILGRVPHNRGRQNQSNSRHRGVRSRVAGRDPCSRSHHQRWG